MEDLKKIALENIRNFIKVTPKNEILSRLAILSSGSDEGLNKRHIFASTKTNDMIIAVNGSIIDTKNIYMITPVTKEEDYAYGYSVSRVMALIKARHYGKRHDAKGAGGDGVKARRRRHNGRGEDRETL